MTLSGITKLLGLVALLAAPSLIRAQGVVTFLRSSPEPLPNCVPASPGQPQPIIWDTTIASLMTCGPGANVWSKVQGASGSGSGSLTAGSITLVAGSAVFTFVNPYNAPPVCTAIDTVIVADVQCTTTTTQATFTGTGTDTVSYFISGSINAGGGGGGGGGSLTFFSAGSAAPLFTTSVTNAATTPVLSFTLSNAAANSVLANCTGAPAAPTYCGIVAAMQPATTVNSVVNDTNVTGSVVAQVLTLGWTGTAAKTRTLATTVYTDQANTFTAGLQDLTAATFKVPNSAGAAPVTNALMAYDTTAGRFVVGLGGATRVLPWVASGVPVNAQCVTWTGTVGQQGSSTCGTGIQNNAQQFAVAYYSAAGVNNALSGIAGPTAVNGVPQMLVSTPAAGVATLANFTVGGVLTVPVVVTSDTIAATDRGKRKTYSNAGATAVTLPQAGTTGFDQGFVFVAKNKGVGLVTVTPTASTIDGALSLPLPTGLTCFIYLDGPGTNYETSCSSSSTGIFAAPVLAQTIQPTIDATGLIVKQFNGVNTADTFSVQDKNANKLLQVDSANNVELRNNVKIGGPNPFIDCTAPPYNAPFTTDPTVPTVDAGAALRACLAALPSTGGVIHLAPGRYGVSTAVTDTYGANAALDLAQKDGVRIECSGGGGIKQSGTNSHPCSIELIAGIPAGTIAIQSGTYSTAGTYAGPVFENTTIVDNTGTGGAGIAIKDSSDFRLDGVSINGFTYAGLAAPAAPTVTATAGGTLGAGVQVFVKVAHRTGWGMTLPSAEASATTAGTCPGSGNCSVTVTAPTNPGAPAIDYIVYASTTTGTEVTQTLCCAGTTYGANYVMSAALATGIIPEVSNRTRGTGLSITSSGGWGTSTSFVNHGVITDLRVGNQTQLAFAHSINGVTSITYVGGDIMCVNGNTPCSAVTDATAFYHTHWESVTNTVGLEVDGAQAHNARGVQCFGCIIEGSTTGSTSIKLLWSDGFIGDVHVANQGTGVSWDTHSSDGYVRMTYPNGTVTTPVVDGTGLNSYCLNTGCVMNTLFVQGNNSNTPAAQIAASEFFTGRDNSMAKASGQSKADIAFQYGANAGGYRNWLSSLHNSGATGSAFNFYVNTSGTAGGSSAPGTGNKLALQITPAGTVSPTVQSTVGAFATLAACAAGTEGVMAAVSDSTTNVWGATVTGGAANHILAYCDGTNWTVAGK